MVGPGPGGGAPLENANPLIYRRSGERPILSPLAKGLFHKAISESGTASRLLFTDQPEEEAKRVAAASGCEKPSSAAIVECLREKTEEEIVQIAQKLHSLGAFGTADGVFFPKSPTQLLFEKLINPVPYIIGVNNCEFGWVMAMQGILRVLLLKLLIEYTMNT
ncbi:hypothetical protein AV530_014950 [Patagioenas fasciata monilis]|uniref:Carboxylesterase type B domain-containing protein n=1 Tax=Patagioenas fasciata monilis TaxID=372326 RepID=A0A1V4K0E4_PATFA|nr:hypothetical protein AV530_014950 [Patagioenas fasciata monilis]